MSTPSDTPRQSEEAMSTAWLIWKTEIGAGCTTSQSVTQIARMIDAGFADVRRELAAATKERDALLISEARLQMELDASCNAEELRQVRAERDEWKRASEFNAQGNRELVARVGELEEEVRRYRTFCENPQALHAHCQRSLTDAQISHLFGERMTEVCNERDQLRAELARARQTIEDVCCGGEKS